MIRDYNIADNANIQTHKLADGIVIEKALKINPPSGYFMVTNLYVDPVTKKLIVEYDDVPVM